MTIDEAVILGTRWSLNGSPNHEFQADTDTWHMCAVCGGTSEGIQHGR